MTRSIFATLLQLTVVQISFSQTLDKIKLDNYFNTLEVNNKFMGSVAVSKNGEIIYLKTIGFSDVDKNIKATDNSKYNIGSISKTFTTVLVLKAAEEKKLDLSQTINNWFPTIKNADRITIKHLLTHRSGIHNYSDNKDYLTWNTQPKTETEMVEIITKGGSDFEPDSKTKYSNSNFVLLAYILEKLFSRSYSSLLQEYIIKPVDLKNTYVLEKIDPNNDECRSYMFAGTWKVENIETHKTIHLGAGGISSTSTDLTKFSDALFGGKLLKPESLELMRSIKDGFGMGLFQIPFYKSIGYGHTGGVDRFSSVFAHFPDEKISYALLSNGTNFINNDISIAVLKAVYGKPYEIPVFTTYNLNSEDLDQYLGVYASEQIALKITFRKEGNTLIGQGTGQSAMPLIATDKNKFKFDPARAIFEFDPTNKTMILIQGGRELKFKKE